MAQDTATYRPFARSTSTGVSRVATATSMAEVDEFSRSTLVLL